MSSFDHRAYMAANGNKPGSKLKLKDGTTYRVPGYAPLYSAEVLEELARAGGVEKYTNKKVAVGELEVTGTNALLPGDAAAKFVRGCVTGVVEQPAAPPADTSGNGHKSANRIPAAVK